MVEHKVSLLLRHLALLLLEALQQVLAHRLEQRSEERAAEHLGRLVLGKTLALHRNLAVAQPPEISSSYSKTQSTILLGKILANLV